MIDNLKISIDNSRVVVKVNDSLGEVDVEELLKFDSERLYEYYLSHASLQAYWEELANKLREDYENFKNVDYKKWWSHSRNYSRLVLSTLGDKKPTNDAINDMVVSIYSEDTTESQRAKYAQFAHKASQASKGLFSDELEGFSRDMYKYLEGDVPCHFEAMERGLIGLERGYESIKIVADRLNSRSFHMQEVAKFLGMKPSNTRLG
jgi:hypothetical protein